MKPLLLTLALLTITGSCFAEVVINMDRIMQIESGGKADAYNKSSQARGLYQITPIAVKDFNKLNGTSYTPNDMFDPQKASRVATWLFEERIPQLLKHYNRPDTLDNRLICYNAGIKAVITGKTPKELKEYIKKYKSKI